MPSIRRAPAAATAFTAAALAAAALVAAPAAAIDGSGSHGGAELSAALTGAAEVPGPGDADGSGSFTATVNPGHKQICFKLTVANIGQELTAHIHTGAAGTAGGVAVPLGSWTGAGLEKCMGIERDIAAALISKPGDYYVNVHDAAFPAGAVRGQLSKK